MPGFTHLQTAQPVTFGHHLHGLCRDVRPRPVARARRHRADGREPARRGRACRHRLSDRPPHDGEGARLPRADAQLARQRFRPRFRAGVPVGSRRSAATHLSRLAEEIVIWSTPQFGFVRLSDGFSTGSSIMPQKKNPDAAELVRAKTGRVNGHLVGAADRHEGPAAAYSKDMQEDKEAGLRRRRDARPDAGGDDRHGRAT